jgi:broad specificity phosphatase PhoE
MMTKRLLYFRHGERLDHVDVDEWVNSDRFAKNQLDVPLSQNGLKQSKRVGKYVGQNYNINDFDYVYCSSKTRCIETAIQMIKQIEEDKGKRIKIRIEYGLTESPSIFRFLYPYHFVDGEIKYHDFDEFHKQYNKKYLKVDSIFDDEMEIENIKTRFDGYIDEDYISLVESKDISIVDFHKTVKNLTKTIKQITENDDHCIIVAHGGDWAEVVHSYLTKIKFENNRDFKELFDKLREENNFNFMIDFEFDKNWNVVYGPSTNYLE